MITMIWCTIHDNYVYIPPTFIMASLPRLQFPAASKVEATTCAADIGGTFSSAAASAKLTASSSRRRFLSEKP